MVLQSQSPRDGMNRRFVTSRRRKRSPWPLLMIAAAVVIAVVIVALPNGEPKPANANGNEGAGGAQANAGDAASILPDASKINGSGRGANTSDRTAAGDTQTPTGDQPKPDRSQPKPRRDDEPIFTNAPPKISFPEGQAPRGAERSIRASVIAANFRDAIKDKQAGRLLDAREKLNSILISHHDDLTPDDRQNLRDVIAELNEELIFSPTPYAGDPLTEIYTVQPNEYLGPVARKYRIPYQLAERINGINANRIRVGQKIKMLKGPVHIRVNKADFRADCFVDGPDGRRVYITSFPVGLGEQGSTPVGSFKVQDKVANPNWTNPRTGEYFRGDDPKNPLGKFWVRLQGTDSETKKLSGYGIHGTIEPNTIGTEASMGCVRMHADHIAMVFDMVVTEHSTVTIAP